MDGRIEYRDFYELKSAQQTVTQDRLPNLSARLLVGISINDPIRPDKNRLKFKKIEMRQLVVRSILVVLIVFELLNRFAQNPGGHFWLRVFQ